LTTIGAVSLLALAGCGGSGTTTPTQSFADVDAVATVLQAQYTDANGDLLAGIAAASGTDINSSANATYSGYVAGDVGGDILVGTLSVEADFGARTTNSTATGFFHETDGAYAGTLSGVGVISPSAPAGVPQVSASLTGNLTLGGVDTATDLALDGNFIPNGGDPTGAIAGTADGTFGAALFSGNFAAEN
jgi:hypothetical protein